METKSYKCHICGVETHSRFDLIRSVINHMKVMHSKLAGAVLSDEEILSQSPAERERILQRLLQRKGK